MTFRDIFLYLFYSLTKGEYNFMTRGVGKIRNIMFPIKGKPFKGFLRRGHFVPSSLRDKGGKAHLNGRPVT